MNIFNIINNNKPAFLQGIVNIDFIYFVKLLISYNIASHLV